MKLSKLSYFSIAAIYIAFCSLQELIIRGTLQGTLQRSLTGSQKNKIWLAIIISNLAFAQVHLHISVYFAIATLLFGIVWGWLYSRHQTLIGVSLSHMIFGTFALFILGTKFLLVL